jgi:hypothetical protein
MGKGQRGDRFFGVRKWNCLVGGWRLAVDLDFQGGQNGRDENSWEASLCLGSFLR